MNQNEQLQILKRAYSLMAAVRKTRDTVDKVKSDIKTKESEQPPAPPVCVQIPSPEPPKITPTIKPDFRLAFLPTIISLVLAIFTGSVLFMLLFMVSIIWIPIYYIIIYPKKRAENIESIRRSPEYQYQYNLLVQEQRQKQDLENQKYQAAKKEYDEKTLPNYLAEREKQLLEYRNQLQFATEKLSAAEESLSDFWASEQAAIVPPELRDIDNLYDLSSVITLMQNNDIDMDSAFLRYKQNVQKRQDQLQQAVDKAYEDQRRMREEQAARRAYEARAYEASLRAERNSFARDVAATAAGVAIGNSISDKRRRREMEEHDRRREEQELARESRERSRRAYESQREYDRIVKLNEERRRKGQPELPLPRREYY